MGGTLIIFDIDGTLIMTKAGRRAFNLAFHRTFGIPDAAARVAMAGRTDPAIFADVCAEHGVDNQRFGVWKLEFLTALADALQIDPGHALPGARALVEALSAVEGLWLALGTGNVEEGARLKLAPHGFNPFFSTGGFGADGTNRAEVIARAIVRSEAEFGKPFDRTLVIGDTPHDIQCGQANHCLTVGVATGPFAETELKRCGADLVLPDFAPVQAVVSQLLRLGA